MKKNQLILYSILLWGAFLAFHTASDGYLHEWDECYHALVAKHMIQYPFQPMLYLDPVIDYDYREWCCNHIWVHKQPLPLWLMAGSMSVFGVNEIALRLPSVLIFLIGIVLTFELSQRLFTECIGLWAAFFHASHGLILELTGGRVATDHYDVFFLFFVELGVYFGVLFIQKKRNYWIVLSGLAMGAGILVKWLPALIIMPILFLLATSEKMKLKERFYIIGILALTSFFVASPWQFYIHQQFPLESAWEAQFNLKHIFEALEGHAHPWWFHFGNLSRLYGAFIYPVLLFFIFETYQKRSFKYFSLLVWIIIPYLFFTFVKTKMQAYTLFCAPAIFLIYGYTLEKLYAHLASAKLKLIKHTLRLCMLLMTILPLLYTIERTKIFQSIDRHPTWVQQIQQFEKTLPNGDRPWIVILGAEHPIETMFYVDRSSAYGYLPNQQKVDQILEKGYWVYQETSNGYQRIK